MAPYHILIVIISSVIPENLVLLTKSEQSGPKSAHIRPTIANVRRHWSTRVYEELWNIYYDQQRKVYSYLHFILYVPLILPSFIASELSWNTKKISLVLPARRLSRTVCSFSDVAIPTQHAKTFDRGVPASLPRFTRFGLYTAKSVLWR